MAEIKLFVIDSVNSNSWKSSNPYSGTHEGIVTKTLDTSCLNPACNQGGVIVYESVSDRKPSR